MNETLLTSVQSAQDHLTPQFKALKAATGALKQAAKLAAEEKADALAMQKALLKMEQASELLEDDVFAGALATFRDDTMTALDALAFDFARDLKDLFEERGETVEGKPPRLTINDLVLNIDIGTRKAQWVYGKEELTRPIPLSFNPILKAYDAQKRTILDRMLDDGFTTELYTAWQQLIEKRSQRPPSGRVSLTEAYSQIVLNRQNTRFWNTPSRSTFKDYDRPLFVRDMVLAMSNPIAVVDGTEKRFALGGATKSQAESAAKSVWLPSSALDGAYYANITFDVVE